MTVINSYEELKQHLNAILQTNGQDGDTRRAPHRDFWNSMTYEEFTTGHVPRISDPDTGNPMPILVVGKPSDSILIKALRATGPFDPISGSFSQMPASGPPYFTDDQIKPIEAWIAAGCPNNQLIKQKTIAKDTFTGLSKGGDFKEALYDAIQQAKEALQTDLIRWEFEKIFGEDGGIALVEHLYVTIKAEGPAR